MANTADFRSLADLRERIETLAGAGGRAQILEGIRAKTHDLTLDCFIQERDPYGNAWAKRKAPKAWVVKAFGLIQSNHKLLDYSGAGINSITSRASATSVFIRVGKDYMRFHLTGTARMVSRKFLPVDGLPQTWLAAYQAVAEQVAQQIVTGGR